MKRMPSFRKPFIHLLWLHLIFSPDPRGGCSETVPVPVPVVQPPSISHLRAHGDGQSLSVVWRVNRGGLAADVYEIQIGRAESHAVIYNRNLSLLSADSDEYAWTWTSDVPLECVDHSVRMRRFDNRSVPSPWSDWVTNYGARAQDETRIFPSQRVLRENASAVFCCVPPRGVSIRNMTFNNSGYPLLSLGTAGVKAIAAHELTIPTAFIKCLSVSCSDSRGKISYAWNYISFPPQRPRNLRCATSDMVTVICSWDSGRRRDPFDRNNQTHTLHLENSDRAPISCKRSSCTFPAVPQREEYNISVVVKDQLGEEKESYSFNISDRVSPVVKVFRVSPGVSHATVSWVVQGNLTRLNLLCQVTTDPDSSTRLSCGNASGLCRVDVEHLLPNTCYSMRVRCSAGGRLWGEWTRPVSFTTHPMVTLDVWRRIKQLPDPNTRQVTLLWTPHVPGSAVTVSIQGYVVQWHQGGQTWTERTDGGRTRLEVDAGRHDFTVRAVVPTGSTTVPAGVTVPQRDDGEVLPAEKRLSGSSGAAPGLDLSWDDADTSTCGYAVEWCILGNAVPCADADVRWLKVPEGNNTLVLPARDFKAGCRYTFNIYGCTEEGHRLLEVQTGYSQELQSVKSPSLVEPARSTSSSVTLEWSYSEDDPAHPAFITGYQVTGREAGSDQFNVSVADPRRKSVTIEGLQQNQEYAFSVSALTKEGPGEPTNVTVRTRTNYSAHLAKILTPVLLLLGCIVLVWPQRKMLKEMFSYPAGMNIKTWELDSFLCETAERLQSQKMEECSSCDIEILNTRGPGSDPDPGPGSFISAPPLQSDYCQQSVSVLWDGPGLQPITCVTNKTYLHTEGGGDSSEAQQVKFTGLQAEFEPSESLEESCSVEYGYVSHERDPTC